ncbi:hypothetical protein C8J56DRAFT_915846 [Mycena floridula]|nr:hypothetical protein C8J56DRAFT_915846 [Mycena floridula]
MTWVNQMMRMDNTQPNLFFLLLHRWSPSRPTISPSMIRSTLLVILLSFNTLVSAEIHAISNFNQLEPRDAGDTTITTTAPAQAPTASPTTSHATTTQNVETTAAPTSAAPTTTTGQVQINTGTSTAQSSSDTTATSTSSHSSGSTASSPSKSSVSSDPSQLGAQASRSPDPATQSAIGSTQHSGSKIVIPIVVVIVVLLLLAAGVGFWLIRRRNQRNHRIGMQLLASHPYTDTPARSRPSSIVAVPHSQGLMEYELSPPSNARSFPRDIKRRDMTMSPSRQDFTAIPPPRLAAGSSDTSSDSAAFSSSANRSSTMKPAADRDMQARIAALEQVVASQNVLEEIQRLREENEQYRSGLRDVPPPSYT